MAAEQHGVISREQALAAGMSRRAVEHRVATGRWRAIHRGVYVPRAVPPSWHQRLLAAVLRGGPRACASHRSAAVLWELDGIEERVIEISVPTAHRIRGATVHRRPWDEAGFEVVDGIRVTRIERTIVDLAGVVSPERAALAPDDALRRALTTPSKLGEAIEALGSRGRAGLASLRNIVARRDARDGRAESRLESALLEILRAHEIPLPASQHEVMDGSTVIARLDFAYPSVRLGIEADGYRWHGGRERWTRDIQRENRLKLPGWTLLRFSWEDVHDRPEVVAGQVRAALHRILSALPTQSVGE